MPAACAADLREELLARVWGPASGRDAKLAAEMDALEAAGDLAPPDDWELGELAPDPRWGPPDGADAWLADLPAELLFEYIAATEDPPCREAIVAGRVPRRPGDGLQAGDGCGFAAGGLAGLGDGHAAAVEQQVLDQAPGQTTGQLRATARRAVLAFDPAAAREAEDLPDAQLEAADLPARLPLPRAGCPKSTNSRPTSPAGQPTLRNGRPTSPVGRPTSRNGRPMPPNGRSTSPDGRRTSRNGWPTWLSAGWRRVIAAICGSRRPTGRRPACGT
jgi:hypothetical protein